MSSPRPWRVDRHDGIVDAVGDPIATGTITGEAVFSDEDAALIVECVNNRSAPTVQAAYRRGYQDRAAERDYNPGSVG